MSLNFVSRSRNDQRCPQDQDGFAYPTTITETKGNFRLNELPLDKQVNYFTRGKRKKLALSQFKRRHQSLIKIYDRIEVYTSVFILTEKPLYVKLALKVSMFA